MQKKKIDPDFGVICVCAVRYALGRRSYMPSLVQDFIYRNLDDIRESEIFTMMRDVEEAESMGYGYGDPKIDKPGWVAFMRRMQAELDSRESTREKTKERRG